MALALGGIGLSNQLGTNRNGTPIQTLFREVNPGGALDNTDLVSAFLFHDPVVYIAYVGLPVVLWFVLFRTRHGMNMRAVGENPAAADVDTCPHRGSQLTPGDFDGERLRCGYHGWQFDIDGYCIHQPAHPNRRPAGVRLRRASVRSDYGFWWVCAGDRPRDLPLAPDHDTHPERTVWLDPVTVESSGPRIIENFLDLAHFPFVHEGYLGQEPHTEVEPYTVEADDGELRLTDCVFWQPDPGPAAAGGGPVRYRYSVSHPYAATLTRVPSEEGGDGAGGFTILIVASPVTETSCVVWRSTVVHDTGADLDAQRAFNELIFSQDIDVVESQRPRRLPVDPRMESHQAADAGSLAYRRWLRAWGIRYGTMSL